MVHAHIPKSRNSFDQFFIIIHSHGIFPVCCLEHTSLLLSSLWNSLQKEKTLLGSVVKKLVATNNWKEVDTKLPKVHFEKCSAEKPTFLDLMENRRRLRLHSYLESSRKNKKLTNTS